MAGSVPLSRRFGIPERIGGQARREQISPSTTEIPMALTDVPELTLPRRANGWSWIFATSGSCVSCYISSSRASIPATCHHSRTT